MALGRLLFKIALSCVVILLSASLSEEIRAQAQTISINEKRIQIAELIKLIGEATQRTILFDDRVRGTVSVVAKRPVTLDEAWSMLDSSLALLGFSLLPSTEGSWRIAKVGDAIGEAPFVHEVAGVRDTYVTSLIPLRVATPAAVMAVLEPLSGASVTLIPLEATNSLIASGPERRIARLTTIADSLDRVEEREVRYRVIRHRNVENVAGWIESFFDSGALSRIDLEVWSDARTNSLIYRGTEDATEELQSGDILMFMPTEKDIHETRRKLEGRQFRFTEILPLFGRLTPKDQQRVFHTRGGTRRIVVATNVAETSLTIPGIKYVIDTGMARMSRYNPRNQTHRLPIEPISQSSAKQRAAWRRSATASTRSRCASASRFSRRARSASFMSLMAASDIVPLCHPLARKASRSSSPGEGALQGTATRLPNRSRES